MNNILKIRTNNVSVPSSDGEQFIPRQVQPRRFHFISANDLIANQTPPNWIVKYYLEAGSVVCLIGPPGSCKTILVLDLGLHVSSGKSWHGRPVTQGPVLYICGEGKNGISRRINAWCRENNIQNAPFFVSNTAAQLTDKINLAEVMAAAAEIIRTSGMPPALLIIDTLNRNFGNGDENSTSDMTQFVSAVDQLRNNLGCAVLIVHHTGISDTGRGRGSSALRGAVDFEYLVKKEGPSRDEAELIRMKATKVKDFDNPPTLMFRPEVVDLGLLDEESRPITSLVLRLAATPNWSKKKAGKMSRATKIAFESLQAVLDESGQAHVDEWKEETFAKGISRSEKPETKQKAFNRAKNELLKDGLIGIEGDYFYILPQETGQTGHLPDIVRTCPGESSPDRTETPDRHGHTP